ncbi:MAG: hypothetical protein ABI205_10385 [Gemmatimonadaceae bacterium]
MTRFVLVAAALWLLAPAIRAQAPAGAPAEVSDPHAVQPERPSVATHAGTVAPGWFEFEAGVERDQHAPAAPGYFTPLNFKFGLADRLQLGVFGSAQRPYPGATGVGDIGAGVKWRLADAAPLVGDFALLPAIKLPAGSAAKGTGTGTTDVSLTAISSHDFGPVALDVNVGYTRRSGDGTVAPTSSSGWAISSGGPFAGRLGWVLECYGYPGTGGPAGQSPIVAVLAGPTFLVRPWLAFDTGAIFPLSGPQPHALYAGAVYNVGRLWGARR